MQCRRILQLLDKISVKDFMNQSSFFIPSEEDFHLIYYLFEEILIISVNNLFVNPLEGAYDCYHHKYFI